MRARASLLSLIAAVAFAAAASGCSNADPETAAIAAKVNGKSISMSRVSSALERGAAKERGREGVARVLERVIDQELLVQGAIEKGLDRDPQVALALDDARRQILAQSYVDRIAAGSAEAGAREVKEFFEHNPALFTQRRIYRFQEVAVDAAADTLGALKQRIASAKGVDELAAWLKTRNVPFHIATATKPAEHVPLNFLPRLVDMRDGEIAVFATPTGASVLQLIQSQEAPLSESQAAPVIERFLASRRRLQLAEAAIAKLREKARIEYIGDIRPGRRELSRRAAGSGVTGEVRGSEALLGEAPMATVR